MFSYSKPLESSFSPNFPSFCRWHTHTAALPYKNTTKACVLPDDVRKDRIKQRKKQISSTASELSAIIAIIFSPPLLFPWSICERRRFVLANLPCGTLYIVTANTILKLKSCGINKKQLKPSARPFARKKRLHGYVPWQSHRYETWLFLKLQARRVCFQLLCPCTSFQPAQAANVKNGMLHHTLLSQDALSFAKRGPRFRYVKQSWDSFAYTGNSTFSSHFCSFSGIYLPGDLPCFQGFICIIQ